jgi:hypothetical protein
MSDRENNVSNLSAPGLFGGTKIAACNRWIESPVGRVALLSAIVLVYLLTYLGHPNLPGANPVFPQGWRGWMDQGIYYGSAASLANASLSADTYIFSLGYPALGALFYHFAPAHAFLIPDLLLVLGIAVLFYRIASHFISPIETVGGMILFVICYHELVSSTLVIPWNSIPTHALSYAVILLVCLGAPSRRRILLAAGCVSAAYLFRVADALCMALPVGIALLRLPGLRNKLSTAASAAGICGVTIGSVLLINKAVFNSWQTIYERTVAAFGFGSYPLVQKAFLLSVDGTPIFQEPDTALISHYPWLILVLPGAVHLVRRFGFGGLGIIATIIATYVMYFAYNGALWPGNIYRYLLIHYISWTLPLLALITYVGLKEAWRYSLGRWSFCSVPLLLFCVSFIVLREKVTGAILPPSPGLPVVIASTAPIDWIEFVGAQVTPSIAVDGRTLFDPAEVIAVSRTDRKIVWVSSRVRSRALTAAATDAERIEYGRLTWSFRWLPRWALPVFLKYFTVPKVVCLGKAGNVDLAGPLGIPDGQSDEVISVALRPWVLRRIASWEIETEFQHRHWSSAANPYGWWLIKPDTTNSPEIAEQDSVIRLCFPDSGDFERAPEFTLRARDREGHTIFERVIRK